MNSDLLTLLRPPGSGIVTYSVPLPWASQVQRALYNTDAPAEVEKAWQAHMQAKCDQAAGFFIGVPTDLGAAIRRGAALGPIGFRSACLDLKLNFFQKLQEMGWIDVGDILCHPYVLSEDMLQPEALERLRLAFWGKETTFPVGILNVVHYTLLTLLTHYPNKPFLAFGGDHSISYPLVRATRETSKDRIGILHFDAHTDLREHRQGAFYNYATWAYHAYMMNPKIPLVQIGLRSSTKTKEQFQKKFKNIRQFWMDECNVKNFDALVNETVQVFLNSQISKLYVSVDVDAVDPELIPCTGTPEVNGVSVDFVNTVIRRVADKCQVVAADITEYAATIGSEEARLLSAKNIARIAEQLLNALNPPEPTPSPQGQEVSG